MANTNSEINTKTFKDFYMINDKMKFMQLVGLIKKSKILLYLRKYYHTQIIFIRLNYFKIFYSQNIFF